MRLYDLVLENSQTVLKLQKYTLRMLIGSRCTESTFFVISIGVIITRNFITLLFTLVLAQSHKYGIGSEDETRY